MSKANVYTLLLDLDWKLMTLVSQIDRFDASWTAIERKEGSSLKELKSIANVRSVGASTRIEGSKLSDEEVDILLKDIDISKLQERDHQEIVGYFEVLDLIAESFEDIPITENGIKNLHNQLLRYSTKDQWHKGNYKQHANTVEAKMPDGSTQVVFQTTEPGFATEDAMLGLINWYKEESQIHPLVICALFSYEFVTIHPFQDGNGRLSRLISTLLLRKHGYKWIQYVSLEHEIEYRKTEYYRVLRSCQSQRPHENITAWVLFFLECIKNIQELLMQKLELNVEDAGLSIREKSVLTVIGNYPGLKSGEISKRVGIPVPTIKKTLNDLVNRKLIEKKGVGPGTHYILY